jgi:hypothetical protein
MHSANVRTAGPGDGPDPEEAQEDRRIFKSLKGTGGAAVFAAIMGFGCTLMAGVENFRPRRALALEGLRDCVSRTPSIREHHGVATQYLVQCAKSALPGLMGSAEGPLLMDWLLDANQPKFRPYMLMRWELIAMT